MFSGSYDPSDVIFLLRPVRLAPTPVAEKERLIQSGQRHYSEMISAESLPSARYLDIFHQGVCRQKSRFARHLWELAVLIARSRPGPLTIVSLARAGTPVGVLLGRTLRRLLGREAVHYSLSIIRDRGIDTVALDWILQRQPQESLVFVDGWTGKGVIARELRQAIGSFNRDRGTRLDEGLHVVADLCGESARAATAEDYLIPSSVLGATVSGLVSRSILNADVVGPGDFHGCVFYEEFRAHDLSNWFVEQIWQELEKNAGSLDAARVEGVSSQTQEQLRQDSRRLVKALTVRFGVRSENHIKPGVGESTRVLLRRVPGRLLVRDPGLPDVAHLLQLAQEKAVITEVAPDLPLQAVALIEELD